MEDEIAKSAKENFDYITFFISLFDRKFVALVSDNTSMNRSFSRMVGRTLVGFHSQRFKLGVKDFILQ